MGEQSKFYFMLPLLVEQGLLEDDSKSYAFTSYPREVVSQAAITIVSDYSNRINSIDKSTKKRVKVIMENLAVALSLPIKYTSLMSTARAIYRKWLENPKMFGDVKRQNKYAKRIFKQLSLPFAFNQPSDNDDVKKELNTVLNIILNDYKYYHTTHGSWFDQETWKTILNTLIGICESLILFDLDNYFAKSDAAKLRQKALGTFFSVMELSGLKDDGTWQLFIKYTRRWSTSLDFIKTWGYSLTRIFVYLNVRIYNAPIDPTQMPFTEGVYSQENPISIDTLSFIFYNFVNAIDRQVITSGTPELLKHFSSALSILTDRAQAVGETASLFFVKRFPAIPFLKIFGPLVTMCPPMDDRYDESQANLTNIVLNIIGNFELPADSEMERRLLSFAVTRSTPERQFVMANFLMNAPLFFRHSKSILPFVSEISIERLSELKAEKVPKIANAQFFNSLTSLFISACETLSSKSAKINDAFNVIHEHATTSESVLQLYSYGYRCGILSTSLITKKFQEQTFRSRITDASNIPLYASMVAVLTVATRLRPETARELEECHTIPTVVECIVKTDTSRIKPLASIVTAVLQFLLAVVEWAPSLAKKSAEAAAIFELIHHLTEVRHKKALPNEQAAVDAYASQLCARLVAPLPLKDAFSRRSGSFVEADETAAAHAAGFKEFGVRHFSIEHRTLVSFVEGDRGILVLARGPFGRAYFMAEENNRNGNAEPKIFGGLDNGLTLSQAKPIEEAEKKLVGADEAVGEVLCGAHDETVRSRYGEQFATWHELPPQSLLERGKFQRPRVGDFLARLGLLGAGSTVFAFKDSKRVADTARRLDELDNYAVVPAVISHVLPRDSSLKIRDAHVRMTPLMKSFLSELGQPLLLTPDVCDRSGFPLLRTAVPSVPLTRGFLGFISPVMASDGTGAVQIAGELAKSVFLRIIFNESDFDIRLPEDSDPQQIVLVVRPRGNGLYHITRAAVPADIISVIPAEETVTAATIAFQLAAHAEQFLLEFGENVVPDAVESRKQLITELEQACGVQPTPAELPFSFDV